MLLNRMMMMRRLMAVLGAFGWEIQKIVLRQHFAHVLKKLLNLLSQRHILESSLLKQGLF